jgi:hypothetical protein
MVETRGGDVRMNCTVSERNPNNNTVITAILMSSEPMERCPTDGGDDGSRRFPRHCLLLYCLFILLLSMSLSPKQTSPVKIIESLDDWRGMHLSMLEGEA